MHEKACMRVMVILFRIYGKENIHYLSGDEIQKNKWV